MCIPKHNRIVFISQYETALLLSILLRFEEGKTGDVLNEENENFDKEK